jgi:hypothetical protein
MKKRTNSKRPDMGKTLISLGMSVAGGFAGNQVTNFLEKQEFMAGKAEFAPLATLALGAIGAIFAPEAIRPVFVGMATVAGTEQIEGLMSSTGAAPASVGRMMQGAYENRLGFVPQVLSDVAAGSKIVTDNGVVVR